MKKTKKTSEIERFLALSDAEKEAEVAPFERGEIPLSESRPLTPKERRLWDSIQRELRGGRPVVGQGAKRVAVTIEKGLLAQADAYARRHDLKRSEMIAKGLKLVMQRRAD